MIKCSKCKIEKSYDYFHKHSSRLDKNGNNMNYHNQCKQCRSIGYKQSYTRLKIKRIMADLSKTMN